MTHEEKVIVSTYTGFLMCDFDDVHKFIEETMQRPVFTHEMASEKFLKELREKLKPKFLELCNEVKE